MKAVLRGKLIDLSASKKKSERACTSRLTAHMKAQEQKEANTPKRSRRQEIIKLRAKINQVETKRAIQRINKTRSWFFEKITLSQKIQRNKETVSKLTKSEMKREIEQQKMKKF